MPHRGGPSDTMRTRVRQTVVAPVRAAVDRASAPKHAQQDDRLAHLENSVARCGVELEAVGREASAATGVLNDIAKAFRVRGGETVDRAVRALLSRVSRLEVRVGSLETRPLPDVRGVQDDARRPGARALETSAVSDSTMFDYSGFEYEFRGDPEILRQTLLDRYADVLGDVDGPIVDIGCGRGEFLEGLASLGLSGAGVEPNAAMAAQARERGLEIHEAEAATYLRGLPDGSLGGIVSIQVVEHLALPDLIEFINLAAAKLIPGGVFLAETLNPQSWIVMHTSFIYDPTHTWPLAPPLLAFLCTSAGLDDVDVRYFASAESHHLPIVDDPGAPELSAAVAKAFEQLNRHLYGPQDFAVVARKPPALPISDVGGEGVH